jgi:hypothetical protein
MAAAALGAAVAVEIIKGLGGRDRTGREEAAAVGHRTLKTSFAVARTG